MVVREVEIAINYLQQVCHIGSPDHIINSTTAVLEALEQNYDLSEKEIQVPIIKLIKSSSRLLVETKSSLLTEIVDTISDLKENLKTCPLKSAKAANGTTQENIGDFPLGYDGDTKSKNDIPFDDVTIESLVDKLRIRPVEKFSPEFPKLEEDTDEDDITMEEKKEETAEKHGEKLVEEEVKKTDDGREVRTKKLQTISVSQSRCHVVRSTRGGGQAPTIKKFTDGTSFFDQDEEEEETESAFSLPNFKRQFTRPSLSKLSLLESASSPGQTTKQRTLEKTSEIKQSVTQKKEKNGRVMQEQSASKTDLSELKANTIDTYQAGQLLDRKGSGAYEERCIIKSENLALDAGSLPRRHAAENMQNFQFTTDNEDEYLCGTSLFSYLRLSDNLQYHEEEFRRNIHFEFSGAGLNIQPLFGNLSDILLNSKSMQIRQPTKFYNKGIQKAILGKTPEIEDITSEDPLTFLNVTDYLMFRQKEGVAEKSEVHGGPIDALITYACQYNTPLLYREAFHATYRTFISTIDLLNKLTLRYNSLVQVSFPNHQSAATHTVGVIIRVVDEVSKAEVNQDLAELVIDLVGRLVLDVKMPIARLLRTKLVEKFFEFAKAPNNLIPTTKPTSIFSLRRESSLFDIRSSELATQLTYVDYQLFQRIETAELLCWAQNQKADVCPNIIAFTEHFNNISFWIRTQIIKASSQKEREKYFGKFLRVAKHLRKCGNFNSLFATLSALSSSALSRLDWSSSISNELEEQMDIMNTTGSYKSYREVLAKTDPPVVPYMGIILQDLTFINVGNSDMIPPERCEGRTEFVNFVKRWRQFAILYALSNVKKWKYDIKASDNVLYFFRKFETYLHEDEVWRLSHIIKPMSTRK